MDLTMVDYGNIAMLFILIAASLTVYFIINLLHAVIVSFRTSRREE